MGDQIQVGEVIIVPSKQDDNTYFIFKKNGDEVKVEFDDSGEFKSSHRLSRDLENHFQTRRYRLHDTRSAISV